MRKIAYRIIFVFILALLCICAIVLSEKLSQKQIILSQTIMPQITSIPQKRTISGNLYPMKEVEIKSAVSGTLETYYIEIGYIVKIGDEIAKVKMLPEPSQLEDARKSLNTSRITLEYDKINYERDSILFQKRIISKADFETISKAYHISKELYESTKNQYLLLEEGYIPASNISNVITSTVSGTIIDLPLDEGMPVSERNTFREGSTVALVAQLDSFIFRGKVVERDVLVLKKGMKIKVIPISQKDLIIDAVVQKISPKGRLEQNVMKYDIEAILTLPDTISIYSGFNAVAEFIIEEKHNILVVPDDVICFEEDSTFVYVLDRGKPRKTHIKIGISDGLKIEIINGLNLEDKILKSKK